ncbi:hypothetical protein MLD38_002157 [Melastoma candidum]|uniref:Uncharacterized protein n=1 Tax=Melastoma candidum TaxID=119954 RepID=A0ACB9SFJ4_9MYRT|nr:hypothetical protein MLD38_002157 [Melastoma candidum]
MEKPKNKILRFLPKVLSFRFGPSRDKDASVPRSTARFSGPIIPREARRTLDTPQEPTSPKVSCLGQIKQHQGRKNNNKLINKDEDARWRRSRLLSKESKGKEEEERMPLDGNAPALGKMRRFASRRSSLSNFDWKAQVAPEEEEDRIALSAPLGGVGTGLMPKKEINLWKRRTTEPPRPLNLGPPRTDS